MTLFFPQFCWDLGNLRSSFNTAFQYVAAKGDALLHLFTTEICEISLACLYNTVSTPSSSLE